MQTTVPLNQLRFGHEAVPPINARMTGRETNLNGLAASIQSHGLIQALTVRRIGDDLFVADGNRRLSALQLLSSTGKLAGDAPIKIDVADDDAVAADELSLAANYERVPMHEADQYEKFNDLRRRGATPEDIANRFGIEVARAKRILAIGQVSPVILQAWRDGAFQRDAFACVAAFTLAPTIRAQETIFKKLEKDSQLWAHTIKRAVGADGGDAVKWVRFVGIDAYKAAGGKVIEDLFGEDHVIADPKLAEKLGNEKIDAMIAEFVKDGWSWAARKADVGETWNWQRLYAEGKPKPTPEQKKRLAELDAIVETAEEQDDMTPEQEAAYDEQQALNQVLDLARWTPEQKAKSGVLIEMGHREVSISYGLIKPGAAKKEKAKPAANGADGKAEKKVPVLSHAQARDLSVQLTAAAQDAIASNHHVGLAALLAGLAVGGGYGYPVMVKAEGMNAYSASRKAESFEAVFERMLAMTDAELVGVAAAAAGKTITLTTQRAEDPPMKRKAVAALVNALEPTSIQTAIAARFDAKDYFTRASKAFIVPAIAEAIGEDEARKAEKMKRDDLVKFALANVPKTGWLPVELRTASYAGPKKTAAAEAKAPAKKAAAKSPAKTSKPTVEKGSAKASPKPKAKTTTRP